MTFVDSGVELPIQPIGSSWCCFIMILCEFGFCDEGQSVNLIG